MSYFCADVNGYLGDVASINGLRVFRMWAQRHPVVTAFLDDGYTTDVAGLVSTLDNAVATGDAESTRQELLAYARKADRVLIVSDGATDEIPDEAKGGSEKGGAGSGNFSHAGRPGLVGGSSPDDADINRLNSEGGPAFDEEDTDPAQVYDVILEQQSEDAVTTMESYAREATALQASRSGQAYDEADWSEVSESDQEFVMNNYMEVVEDGALESGDAEEWVDEQHATRVREGFATADDPWMNSQAREDAIQARADAVAWAKWQGLSDDERFQAAENAGVLTELAKGTPRWDIDGDDRRVRMIAREMVTRRTEDLLEQRGLADGGPGPSTYVEKVWSDWRVSSTSNLGLALQLATSRELGGVNRLTIKQTKDAEAMASTVFAPDEGFADDRRVGMGRLQAHVRAQWETTQFLLDKSGHKDLTTYRGVMWPASTLEGTTGPEAFDGERLPTLRVMRNGASSTTRDVSVANSWNGVDVPDDEPMRRVVLRINTPRTAVLSVPIFGENEQGEHEVVLAGTKGKWKWDAYVHHAPEVGARPIGKSAAKTKPIVIDFAVIDQGPHWLSGGVSRFASTPDQKIAEAEITKGGAGSGNFGHAGRPGQVGGSTANDGSALHVTGGATPQALVERIENSPAMSNAELQSVREKVELALQNVIGSQDWDITVPITQVGVRAGAAVAVQLAEMKAQGYVMPRGVRIIEENEMSGTFFPKDGMLHVAVSPTIPSDVSLDDAARAAFTFESNATSAAASQGIERAFTIESFKDIVVHEMGHANHFAKAKPPMLWGGVEMPDESGLRRVMRAADMRKIATSVSEYAQTSPPEFVAEAFTWQYKGGTLTEDATKLYAFLKGPKVKQ